MRPTVYALPLLFAAAPLAAQTRPPTPPAPPQPTRILERVGVALVDPDAPRLGITLGVSDTAGIVVDELVETGPAAKAGLKVGDRLQAINGVSLRMDPADSDDPALADMMARRLQREMAKRKPGDAVQLRVASGGSVRTISVTAVAERDLRPARVPGQPLTITMGRPGPRALLGVSLGTSASVRDTLGVFVAGVTAGGAADQAGIIEGDRIASINGVDLRVPREDAGDARMAEARMDRLQRELGKVEPGAVVTLRVISGGRSREVKVTMDSARGGVQELRWEQLDADVRRRSEEAMLRAREAMERVRVGVPARIRVVEGRPRVIVDG
jgi:serine protease Do